jgi:ketosteroid isomerase-like protein
MDPLEAARHWIARYSAAWKGRDAEAISRLYAENAVYRSHPFRDALHGHSGVLDYTRWAFSSEKDVDFWFGEPIAAADRAAVEYWAVILDQHGKISTLAGTVVLRFAADGLVTEHRDCWVLEEGRRAPYDGWADEPDTSAR